MNQKIKNEEALPSPTTIIATERGYRAERTINGITYVAVSHDRTPASLDSLIDIDDQYYETMCPTKGAGLYDYYALKIEETNRDLEYSHDSVIALPAGADIDLFASKFLLGFYGAGNALFDDMTFGPDESAYVDSIDFNNGASASIDYKKIDEAAFNIMSGHIALLPEDVFVQEICFQPDNVSALLNAGFTDNDAWVDLEEMKALFPGEKFTMYPLHRDKDVSSDLITATGEKRAVMQKVREED